MTTRLGLDIGTNSIGWCLYEGDSIKDIGVRIFSDGRDPKSGASLAVDRRDARSARRRRDRFIGRRSALLRELIAYGLLPADRSAAKALEVVDPYALRVRALDERLEAHEIGRALFHLNQRRGFRSNRRADRVSKDAADGKIAGATKALNAEMSRLEARTYAEFLLKYDAEQGSDRKFRIRMRSEGEEAGSYAFYPDRDHYLKEFEAVWSAQAAFNPALLTDAAKTAILRVIFHQRDLKPQVVGKCTFAGWGGVPEDETRLPKAHPLFQQRRLYEEVNQLEIVTAGASSRKLTMDERDTLILKLRDKAKVSFASLAKAIKLPEGARFNKERENRKELIGDEVRASLGHKDRFAGRWGEFSTEAQCTIIDRLLNEESTEKLLDWLKASYSLDTETAEAVANARLPDGHGRFGLTATTKLLEQLRDGQDADGHPLTYAAAADKAGFHHSDFRTGECHDTLPYYGEILAREIAPGKEDYGDALERQWGKITNPTVHIGLNQLRKLVNAIIRQYGRPDQIFVELARELKLNEKQKAEHNRKIKQNTDAAQSRSKLLGEMDLRDTGGNRLILKLWSHLAENILDRRCPYCGEQISQAQILNSEVDIDHIIPYSKCLDDSVANKVLCHSWCNKEKGQETPYGKWGGTPRWEAIQDQVARLHKSKQWRFAPDAMERVERDGGFQNRQLTDTQYLSRIAAKYLGSLYPEKGERHVYAVTGRMTAMLRRIWGLNELLPDHNYVENPHSNAPKNRLDHRHHAIDAAVVGATTPAMIAEIAKAAGRAEAQELDKLFVDLPEPWDGFRDELRDRLLATTVSHKADHGRKGTTKPGKDVTAGRLHNDTAYGLTGRTNAKGVPIVTVRKPLLSLQPKDLTDPERMSDKELQDRLYEATKHASGDTAFKAALRQFAKRDGDYKGIRRVRLTEALNVIPIHDKEGRAYKGVKGDANARFDVWRLPDGKWVSKWTDRDGVEQSGVVSMFNAHQQGRAELKPHPAAKRVLSLRQNDLVAVERDGGAREIMRVVKFSSIGSMQLASHNEAGALKGRDADPVDPFKYINTSATGLKNMKARQIRIDELGHIHDPGTRD